MDYTSTSSTTTNKPLTTEMLTAMIEEVLKNKVTYKASGLIEIGTFFIIDHEKIRYYAPGDTERGKTIFYNPADEAIINQYRYGE